MVKLKGSLETDMTDIDGVFSSYYIMKTRVDSQVYFSDRIEITELERFVRKHAGTDIKGLKMYYVLTVAIVRLLSRDLI